MGECLHQCAHVVNDAIKINKLYDAKGFTNTFELRITLA